MTGRRERILDGVLSLVLGAACAGCDEPGTLLCAACRSGLEAAPAERILAGGVPATAALLFDGVAARCIRALKEDGDTRIAKALAPALHRVLPADPDVLLVPVPTSRAAFRRRGYRVPELLIRAAGRIPVRALAAGSGTRDQRELDRGERQRNVSGSMRALGRADGRPVVVVDDVITTGATLAEAARVLSDRGFLVRGAVALATTPRRGRTQSRHIGNGW